MVRYFSARTKGLTSIIRTESIILHLTMHTHEEKWVNCKRRFMQRCLILSLNKLIQLKQMPLLLRYDFHWKYNRRNKLELTIACQIIIHTKIRITFVTYQKLPWKLASLWVSRVLRGCSPYLQHKNTKLTCRER